MKQHLPHCIGRIVVALSVAAPCLAARAWVEPVDLLRGSGLDSWKKPTGDWYATDRVEMDTENPRMLRGTPHGSAASLASETRVIVNGATGKTRNLVSTESFGDVDLHLEFMVPKGSNSGVKLMGLYEIQIYDSWGKDTPTASDCGGIYPRAELKPKYHHIDKGIPPRVNACRPPGEWQTLDIVFRAPRFDSDGRKTANARFVKVALNGEVVHDDVEMPYPTGHAWRDKEPAAGPILLQADHGPVAFRNVRVRRL